MKEYYYEKLLKINTRNNPNASNDKSIHYHPYEPTPYKALEMLFKNYDVRESAQFVDFGCGLGRFNFYTHYFYEVPVTGIEGNENFYNKAMNNRYSYRRGSKGSLEKIQFIHCLAEDYEIKIEDNCFYFFHPFSIQIFKKVVRNILLSVEKNKRVVDLILYYPNEEYTYYLEYETLFELFVEVEIPELSKQDPYERLLVYRLDY